MKMPKAWLTATNKTKKRVTAKFELDEKIGEGVCPITGTQMERMVANGHEVWCNFSDRIVLPIKDQ